MCLEKFNFSEKIFSVRRLPPSFFRARYCVVGAGPTLDLCEHEIYEEAKRESVFILTDAVAQNFSHRFASLPHVVISVENRPHSYLRFLKNSHIFFYHAVRRDNLPFAAERENFFYPFHLVHEDLSMLALPWREKSFALPSPGSVGGLALSLAFFLLLAAHGLANAHVTLLGLDFSYPDNRVFSRYAHSFFSHTRFAMREGQEFLTVLKKTSVIFSRDRQIIRSSFELQKSAENCSILLAGLPNDIGIDDFSPLGISSPRAEKKIPRLYQKI